MTWSCFIHTISEWNSQFQITVIASKFSVLPKFEEFGQIFPFWPAQKLSYAISCFRSAILTHLLIKDFSNVNFFEIFLVWRKTILVQKNCGSYFHEAKGVVTITKFPTYVAKIILWVKSLHLTQKLLLRAEVCFNFFCILPSIMPNKLLIAKVCIFSSISV